MERSLEVKHVGVVNRFFTGLLCVFGGWCVLVLSCHLYFYVKHQTRLAETAARFAEMGMAGWQPSPPPGGPCRGSSPRSLFPMSQRWAFCASRRSS